MNRLGGIPIIASLLAVTLRKEVSLERLNKRRRRWRVRVTEVQEPACFWSAMNGGCYYMHPKLIAELKSKVWP